MKIAVFLFEQGVNPKSPKVTQKSISIQQLKSEYHPDVLKKNHLSCFVDIEIEDNSIVRENKEIQTLSNTLSLTSSALEEIVTDQRPRLEYNVDFAFMLFKSISLYPSGEEHKIEYQVGLKIYDNVVLCVHYAQPTSLNVLQRYFERNAFGLNEGGITYLTSTYLDCLIDPIFHVLARWRKLSKEMEQDILEEPRKKQLNLMMDLRQAILDLEYILRADKEVVNRMLSLENLFDHRFIPPELDDHIVHCMDESNILRNIISDLMNIYYSSESSILDRSLARLTVITALFLFPSLIAGIFGMNNPGFPNLNFNYVILIMVCTILFLFAYFKKRHFI